MDWTDEHQLICKDRVLEHDDLGIRVQHELSPALELHCEVKRREVEYAGRPLVTCRGVPHRVHAHADDVLALAMVSRFS